ncbi:biotin--[acetyl-CoA-carboxylase] ligase [Flavicella sp.]|uniref:biotin--[acetyl-CoA-carboxylase] ligase n=1 Tax=Flavicella sp. TaxID=2957742 RepID=UPI0030170715
MYIIKLDAIGSTNSFLKDLVSNSVVENYTVVTAEYQTNGRGQMGTTWESEPGKNLMFSVFVELLDWKLVDAVNLNYIVTLVVFTALKNLGLPRMSIKWPNDILSDNKKICGILLENSVNSEFLKSTIIGIGVNVNQEFFSEDLSLANSIKRILGVDQDRMGILQNIVSNLKEEVELCSKDSFIDIKERYLKSLYKYFMPSMFESAEGVFMGKIVGINSIGNLEIEMEDESVRHFGLKEVKMLREVH